MRLHLAQAALALTLSACILGDANPFADVDEGCLEAGEEVVIDLSEAKVAPAIDAATVPAWGRAPDSDRQHLHLQVRGCAEGWSHWSGLGLVGDIPDGRQVSVRTRTREDATWFDGQSDTQGIARFDAAYSTYSEGGDLEIVVDLDAASDARVDQIVLIRSCSEYEEDPQGMEPEDEFSDYDEGC